MAQCLTPFVVTKKISNEKVPVPCGKCPECMKRRISGWSFRLMEEEKYSYSAYFLTLTYDTRNVHITKNGYMGLCKRDLQLFFKRLRKAHPKTSATIKYYACGEYGGKTNRPHYHVILFNAELKLIQPAWNLGQIHYGMVSGASVGYTLKYMSKPSRIPMHRNDDRQREFSLMSKGIGKSYLSKQTVAWHIKGLTERMYVTTADGKKVSMPRYYKQKIYHETQRKAIAYATQKRNAEQQKIKAANGKLPTEKQRVEGHRQAFERMYANSEQNRNKI